MQNNLNYKNNNKCNSKPQKKKKYCSGLPFPPPGYLPDSGIEPVSLTCLALVGDSLPLCHLENIHICIIIMYIIIIYNYYI